MTLQNVNKYRIFIIFALVHSSRIGSAVRLCACNPLFQNTTAHITTVAMQAGLKGSPMMLCAEVYREFVATRELLI